MKAADLACRHCGAPLTLLQQKAGHCGAAGCRHRENRAREVRLTQQLGEPALQAAAAALQGPRPTLLWLLDAEARVVPVPKARREAHRAHLAGLVETPAEGEVQPLAEAADAATLGAQEGRLCAECRGRCCGQGAPTHAFMTLPQLLRWQQREAGRTLQEAADWFMAHVPSRHARNGCIYQGAQGCVLPRGDRADICNSYACDALVQMQQELRENRDAAFVAVTRDGDEAARRALITASSTRPL